MESESGGCAKVVMEHEISEMGNEYAVISKGKSTEHIDESGRNAPPPLPKRFRERFNEDSPYSTVSDEKGDNRSGVRSSHDYIELDIEQSQSDSENIVHTDDIAYAVVRVGRDADDTQGMPPTRRERTPQPYENAVAFPPSTNSRPKRPPAYEEIDADDSPQLDGKWELCFGTSNGTFWMTKTMPQNVPLRGSKTCLVSGYVSDTGTCTCMCYTTTSLTCRCF